MIDDDRFIDLAYPPYRDAKRPQEHNLIRGTSALMMAGLAVWVGGIVGMWAWSPTGGMGVSILGGVLFKAALVADRVAINAGGEWDEW